MFAFREGMQTLTDALARRLAQVELATEAVDVAPDTRCQVVTARSLNLRTGPACARRGAGDAGVCGGEAGGAVFTWPPRTRSPPFLIRLSRWPSARTGAMLSGTRSTASAC